MQYADTEYVRPLPVAAHPVSRSLLRMPTSSDEASALIEPNLNLRERLRPDTLDVIQLAARFAVLYGQNYNDPGAWRLEQITQKYRG